MEGGEVEVNVRMKDYWENRYTHKQVSRLSFRWDRGIFGVCLPIISFQNLKNSIDIIIRVFMQLFTAINTCSNPAPYTKTGILI